MRKYRHIFRPWLIRLVIGLMLLICVGFVLDRYVFPLPVERLERPHSQFIYARDGRLLTAFASPDFFWRKPVTLDEISLDLVRCVIACEDRWFYYHPGFNPVSLVEAAVANAKAGRIVRGGSTITMQIARMMEPKSRTIGHKLIEILRSIQLECHYSKDELLDIYFNTAPYGGNIEGVGAAAHFYFGKRPDRLTLSEAAILTAIPASPNLYRPDIDGNICRARRDRVLAYLHESGIITDEKYRTAIAEEIPNRRLDRPFDAPHFCQTIAARYPDQSDIVTTIDPASQSVAERLAQEYIAVLHTRGIHNLSVVVIDNRSGKLLAQVGSPDFDDARHHGQINGAYAHRSPGSALKPFIYALGFESGAITPSTRLDDIPVSYRGYSPENYDRTYHGVVPVRDALIQSLNVPAVNLTAQIGLRRYYDLLKAGGLSSLTNEYDYYGLPLVLGSGEVSLMDLSTMYAAIARGGDYVPTRDIIDADTTQSTRILSRETCYILATILAELHRPDLPTSWEFTADMPTVAWKTGTSFGRRDAWAIGYNPDYTVGVWAGNFSGEGSPYLVGAEAAAPLMLSLFREIAVNDEPTWYHQPPGVGIRDVCTVSGDLPGENCPSTRRELYIKGVSSCAVCPVHRRILVDHQTGYMLCRACAYGKRIDSVIVEDWPPRVSAWLLDRGIIPPLPEHNPQCRGIFAENIPVIVSPEDSTVFVMQPGIPGEYQKILFDASVALDSRTLHWFLDSRLFATCEVGNRIFYAPEPGRHTLMCVDEFGRSSKISFEVK